METGRYINTERQSCLCTRGIGDGLHYFSKCNNVLLKICREKYISHIKKKGERFYLFNETNIAMYALMFHDDSLYNYS